MLSFSNSELIELILIQKSGGMDLRTSNKLDNYFEEIADNLMTNFLKYKKFAHINKGSETEDIKYKCVLFLYSKIDQLRTEKAKNRRQTVNFFWVLSARFIQQELCSILRITPTSEPAKKEYRSVDEPWEVSLFINI